MHLRQRSTGHRHLLEIKEQLVKWPPEILFNSLVHRVPGGDWTLVKHVLSHGQDILAGQQMVQHRDVLPQLDVDATVGKAQVEEAVGAALVTGCARGLQRVAV